MGLFAPESYPFRDPRNPKQMVGRVVNPVGYMELGGLTGPGQWGKGDALMKVDRATSTGKIKSTKEPA